MTRRDGIWIAGATLFTLVNAVGAGAAGVMKEPLHAGTHVALTLLGTYWIWWLAARAWRRDVPSLPAGDERLELLQHSMDAVAVEVERIGEAQRFSAKLEAEKREQRR